jgi:hypothetical protein
MSTWFYYDGDGQKQGPYNGGQLKWLAKNGKITQETIVETEEGKTAPARKVKGLTFGETEQPKTPPSAEPDKPDSFTAEEQAEIDKFCSMYEKIVPSGSSLLHIAAGTGKVLATRFLVSTGTDVNAKDSVGAPPLHYAVNDGNVDIAKLLVFKGADVNA